MDGEELRRRRLALGLSQAELAARLGAAKNTVARWERNERNIRHPLMLAAVLANLEAAAHRRASRRRATA